MDEHDYSYAGYTLRTTGTAKGWSIMDSYKILLEKGIDTNIIKVEEVEVDIGQGKEHITLVEPFMDHPPLASLVYSLGLKNIKKFDDVKVTDYRKIQLIVSVITGILIFICAYVWYKNFWISLLSFIVYSTIPNFIFLSRFALLENILVPISLFNLILVKLYLEKKNFWILIGAGVVSGAAILTKEQGVFVILTGIIILLINKIDIRKLLQYIMPCVILVGTYYWYTFSLSSALQVDLLLRQSGRAFFGPMTWIYSFVQPRFRDLPFDGWWLFGIISIFLLTFKNFNKNLAISVSFLAYLFVYLFFGGGSYAWYLLPFLPFIVIAIGVTLYNIWQKFDIINWILLFCLAFSSSFYWGYFIMHEEKIGTMVYRAAMLVFLGLIFVRKIKYGKLIFLISFLVILYLINRWNWQGFLYITSKSKIPEIFKITH
jgi:4-amino-4-deoxy-L-arabinose transferase-like glycosyltransferase